MYQRKLDELGRIVIPKELQLKLGVREGCTIAMAVQADHLLLVPAERCCAACGAITKQTQRFKALRLCPACVQKSRTVNHKSNRMPKKCVCRGG